MEASDEGGSQQSYEQAYQQKLQQLQQAYKAELQAKALLKRLLTSGAYERISRIKLSSPELYGQLLSMIAYLYQQGSLRSRVSEEQLKELVSKILQRRKETTIKRVSK
jgi:DNA-binding TFAR19-related protein (PDSD5 family)